MLYTPEYTATVVASYSFRLSEEFQGFVRGDFEQVGAGHTAASSCPRLTRRIRRTSTRLITVVNMALGSSFGSYEVSLYAKNLLNDQTILQSPTVNTVTMAYTMRPRTVGVALQAKF